MNLLYASSLHTHWFGDLTAAILSGPDSRLSDYPFALLTNRRPRWLSWMRRPTGDQEVPGSTPAEVGNILSWRLIMKYFLRSFSPFR